MSIGHQHFSRCASSIVASLILLVPVLAAAQTPVAEYAFDETSGTSLSDTSGNENSGTTNGTTWAAGQYNGAIDFGNGDYVTVPDSATLDLTTQLTISAWIRPTRLGSYRTIVAKGDDNRINYYFDTRSSGLSFGGRNGTFRYFEANNLGITLNTWQQVAVVYDTTATPDTRFYRNGIEVASGNTGNLRANDLPLRIGRATFGEQFRGRLDNVRIYDQALTASEIVTDMQTPAGSVSPPDITPPAVSITSPDGTQPENGVVTLDANASDNVGVAAVAFYLDGGLVGNDTIAPYSMTWDSTTVADGAYTLTAVATDTSNNSTTSPGVSFDVINTPTDTTPPAITDVITTNITETAATIEWTTDEPATSALDYGLTTGYGYTQGDSALMLSHSVNLVTLTPDTTYNVRIRSTDPAGNEGVTANFMFATAIPPDTTPPVVSIASPDGTQPEDGVVTLNASASDNVGVENVTFYLDGGLVGNDSTAPYSVTWDSTTVADGTYTLAAVATDTSNNATTSPGVTFDVINTPPDTTPPVIMDLVTTNVTETTITIGWTTDEPATSNLDYGPTTGYGNTLGDSALMLSHTVNLIDLTSGTTYNYQIRSTDAAGNERITANFTFATAVPPDTTPPVIRDVVATNITETTITIGWTTDEAATSNLDYGLTTGYGSTQSDGALVLSHSVALAGLTPDTTYNYQIRGTDAAGNEGVTPNVTFATAVPPDTTPPAVTVTNPDGTEPENDVVTLDANASDNVGVAAVAFYLDGELVGNDTASPYGVTWDSTTVADGTYTLTAVATDTSNNTTTSPGVTFDVINTPPDTTPPAITDVITTNVTETTITIGWTTDELATSNLDYGLTTGYGDTRVDSALVLSHSVNLVGLTPGTTYNFQIRSADAAENEGITTNFTFTTAVPPDIIPPVITDVVITNVTDTTITVGWTTDELATSNLDYGTTIGYGSTQSDSALVLSHAVDLVGLTPGTTYNYQIRGADAAGNEGVTANFTLTTGGSPPDVIPPVISNVTTINVLEDGATVTWNTDENADGSVDYGTATGSYSTTAIDAAITTSHFTVLAGLQSNTTYYYRIRSTDASGNVANSTESTFTTLFVDTESPTVPTELSTTGISPTTVGLSWNTSFDNVGVAGYRLRRDSVVIAITATATYSDDFLLPGTTYTYDVEAFDTAGNNSGFSAVRQATTIVSGGGNISLINQTPNTWVRISRGDVTAPSNITSYSGGWFDDVNGQFCIFGGGHWDYSGNEVWCLDTETLAWSEQYAPDAIVVQGGSQGAYNNYDPAFPGALFNPSGEDIASANPAARHTYDQLEFIPGSGGVLWGGYAWGDGSTSWCNTCSDTWAFDFMSNDWNYLYDGSNPSPNFDAGVGSSAYSAQSDLMYSVSEGETWTFDPSTNQWTRINTSAPYGIEATMEYDENRNVLYYFGGRYPTNTTLYEFEISTNAWTALSPSGTRPGSRTVRGPGMAFDTQSDVLAIFSRGSIWIYDPNFNSWQQLSTSGGPASNDYVFGRFRYDPVNHGFWSHTWENGAHETWFYKYTASQ